MTKQTKPMAAQISDDGDTVTINRITRSNGVAGQVSVTARVTYAYSNGQTERTSYTLVGNLHGGPVVAIVLGGQQVFVANPERFGSFAADPSEYVRRYVLSEA
jgi:hypothetical protein